MFIFLYILESPTAMCEMVTDFSTSKDGANENKVIETNH